jgi:hypothetical protein
MAAEQADGGLGHSHHAYLRLYSGLDVFRAVSAACGDWGGFLDGLSLGHLAQQNSFVVM